MAQSASVLIPTIRRRGVSALGLDAIHYTETRYGFEYGSVKVERLWSDERKGCVVLLLSTPRAEVEVYVSKTGLLRLGQVRRLEKKP